jgi:hypothetical protein
MCYTDADIYSMCPDHAQDISQLKSSGGRTDEEIRELSPDILQSILKLNT